jgi:hypothetical protein
MFCLFPSAPKPPPGGFLFFAWRALPPYARPLAVCVAMHKTLRFYF